MANENLPGWGVIRGPIDNARSTRPDLSRGFDYEILPPSGMDMQFAPSADLPDGAPAASVLPEGGAAAVEEMRAGLAIVLPHPERPELNATFHELADHDSGGKLGALDLPSDHGLELADGLPDAHREVIESAQLPPVAEGHVRHAAVIRIGNGNGTLTPDMIWPLIIDEQAQREMPQPGQQPGVPVYEHEVPSGQPVSPPEIRMPGAGGNFENA